MPFYEVVIQHRGATRVMPLPERGVVGIGRDPEQAIHIDDPAASRQHAVLVIEEDRVVVEDCGSANGTIVTRGERTSWHEPTAKRSELSKVRGSTPLGAGDSLLVGDSILLLREAPNQAPSEPMAKLLELVDQVAASPIRVLLIGETGAGKEVLADRIHARSHRAEKPIVRVHCGALSENLLESELFGHEKGAFTGAVKDRVGLIESAHGGTLFLDEVGEMPPSLQVKLLRVLEDAKVQRVGSSVPRAVDVRVVSATHRDLAREVKGGRFRQDLYFRLNGITLRVPPLRERRSEILTIAAELLARAGSTSPLDEGARTKLLGHAWPGNVRELRQVLERALALSSGDAIGADAIVLDEEPVSSRVPEGLSLDEEIASLERRRIEKALAECDGNQTRAAELLGMPRRTLVERLRTWGMTKPRKP